MFFPGGLVSEVMSAGMATVVLAAPSYVPDANAALSVQALKFVALLQGQVGLGVAIIAVSVAMWEIPAWRLVAVAGLVAGTVDLARPLAVAMPGLAIALFVPTFVWIALASLRLIRADREGQLVCYFHERARFKARYAILGFSDKVHLDDGSMLPVVYALPEMTLADEARISALVKKAMG